MLKQRIDRSSSVRDTFLEPHSNLFRLSQVNNEGLDEIKRRSAIEQVAGIFQLPKIKESFNNLLSIVAKSKQRS